MILTYSAGTTNFVRVYIILRVREVSEDAKKTLVSQVKGEDYGVAQDYARQLLGAVREAGQLYDPHLLQPCGPPYSQLLRTLRHAPESMASLATGLP